MSISSFIAMPWAFIYESHNTMVNSKRKHLINSSKLCLLNNNNSPCTISMDLNNPLSPEQPYPLKMYSTEAEAICKDAYAFFNSMNYNVNYLYSNNDKMTCNITFNNPFTKIN